MEPLSGSPGLSGLVVATSRKLGGLLHGSRKKCAEFFRQNRLLTDPIGVKVKSIESNQTIAVPQLAATPNISTVHLEPTSIRIATPSFPMVSGLPKGSFSNSPRSIRRRFANCFAVFSCAASTNRKGCPSVSRRIFFPGHPLHLCEGVLACRRDRQASTSPV